jgi:hypothetical protein
MAQLVAFCATVNKVSEVVVSLTQHRLLLRPQKNLAPHISFERFYG